MWKVFFCWEKKKEFFSSQLVIVEDVSHDHKFYLPTMFDTFLPLGIEFRRFYLTLKMTQVTQVSPAAFTKLLLFLDYPFPLEYIYPYFIANWSVLELKKKTKIYLWSIRLDSQSCCWTRKGREKRLIKKSFCRRRFSKRWNLWYMVMRGFWNVPRVLRDACKWKLVKS